MLESLLAGDNAVAEAIVESPVVLAVDVALGVEPVDLASEPGGEFGRVEPVDQADPTLARQQLLVIQIDVVSEHRYQARARYHDPLLRVLLASRGRSRSRGRNDGDTAPGGGPPMVGPAVSVEWGHRRWAESRGLKGLHGGLRERARESGRG